MGFKIMMQTVYSHQQRDGIMRLDKYISGSYTRGDTPNHYLSPSVSTKYSAKAD